MMEVETIKTHIAQLADMADAYPDLQQTFQIQKAHLKGLLRETLNNTTAKTS